MNIPEHIIDKMKACGWSENQITGTVSHCTGMSFNSWQDALFACIEVASEV